MLHERSKTVGFVMDLIKDSKITDEKIKLKIRTASPEEQANEESIELLKNAAYTIEKLIEFIDDMPVC